MLFDKENNKFPYSSSRKIARENAELYEKELKHKMESSRITLKSIYLLFLFLFILGFTIWGVDKYNVNYFLKNSEGTKAKVLDVVQHRDLNASGWGSAAYNYYNLKLKYVVNTDTLSAIVKFETYQNSTYLNEIPKIGDSLYILYVVKEPSKVRLEN